jgi:hypothetical protein
MRRLPPTIALTILILIAAGIAGADQEKAGAKAQSSTGFVWDACANIGVPVTFPSSGEALPHFGFSASFGAEIVYGPFIPARVQLSAFHVDNSRLSSDWSLFRAWSGLRFAALTGLYLTPRSSSSLRSGRIDTALLAGAAVSAASFSGTTLAYAYPSALLELRAEASSTSPLGFRASIPVELMFRGGSLTASVGLAVGMRFGLSRGAPGSKGAQR